MLEGDYFEDGYTYGLELLLTSLGGAELSDFVSVTLTTPAGTYDMDVMVSAPFVMCNYLFGEVNDDGTEKVITSIEISSAVEIDPVTGQLPEYDPNNFTVTKVNGGTSLVSEIDDIYLYTVSLPFPPNNGFRKPVSGSTYPQGGEFKLSLS